MLWTPNTGSLSVNVWTISLGKHSVEDDILGMVEVNRDGSLPPAWPWIGAIANKIISGDVWTHPWLLQIKKVLYMVLSYFRYIYIFGKCTSDLLKIKLTWEENGLTCLNGCCGRWWEKFLGSSECLVPASRKARPVTEGRLMSPFGPLLSPPPSTSFLYSLNTLVSCNMWLGSQFGVESQRGVVAKSGGL